MHNFFNNFQIQSFKIAAGADSEGFVSTPLDNQGARPKDSYFPLSKDNASELKDTEAEYKRVKSGFSRITRNNRQQKDFSRSESSRSPSPGQRQSLRRSHNLQQFKIATFYPTDVELWFNQIETQFDLHDITDDDKRYRLICAALLGEVASDVRDVFLQPFLTASIEISKGSWLSAEGWPHLNGSTKWSWGQTFRLGS